MEIQNDTLDVHWIFHLMDSRFKEVLGEDEVFKKVEKICENGGKHANVTHSMVSVGFNGDYDSYAIGFGISFFLVGILGLYFKITDKHTKPVSKFVRSCVSVWCCVQGIFLAISGSVPKLYGLAIGLAVRICIFALKKHTIIVFTFQNILIYYPFYFEERKKKLANLLMKMTTCQWVISVCAPFIGAVSFILCGLKDCPAVVQVAFVKQCIYQSLLILGYIGSFISSIVYMIGFYKENKTNIISTASRKRNIRQTMVACSVEVICDMVAIGYHLFFASTCTLNMKRANWLTVNDHASRNICDASIKLELLDSGVPVCILWIMLVQQLVQELVFVIAVIVDRRGK